MLLGKTFSYNILCLAGESGDRWHAKCKWSNMKLTGDTGVVTCLVDMRFDPGEASRAVQLLLTVVERIKAKAGCQSCWVSRDAVENRRIRYSEIWTEDAAFLDHVRSEEFRRVLVALDMCCEEPAVTIGELAGRTGMDYLRDLRDGLDRSSVPDARTEQ